MVPCFLSLTGSLGDCAEASLADLDDPPLLDLNRRIPPMWLRVMRSFNRSTPSVIRACFRVAEHVVRLVDRHYFPLCDSFFQLFLRLVVCSCIHTLYVLPQRSFVVCSPQRTSCLAKVSRAKGGRRLRTLARGSTPSTLAPLLAPLEAMLKPILPVADTRCVCAFPSVQEFRPLPPQSGNSAEGH